MEEQIISLAEILESLKRRWLLILLITILCIGVAAGVSIFLLEPEYETSTKLFIGKEESSVEGYNTNDISMYQKLLKTYSETIKTKDLVNRALSDKNYNKSAQDVLKALNVVTVADTQILQVTYRSKSPGESKEVLEKVTAEFIKTSTELVPNGNVKIIETVDLPEHPVSPNVMMNIAIAFLFGLMMGVGLAFLLEYMDNTYKSKEQLENDLDIPVLGMIPDLEG